MGDEILKYYSEECPNCESWDVRIMAEEWDSDTEGYDIEVYCRSCGFEWMDYIDEVGS